MPDAYPVGQMISNDPGAAYLSGVGTYFGTFYGPPLVVVADGIASPGDARWSAALAFCDVLGMPRGALGGAPLVGFDSATDDPVLLLRALLLCNHLYDASAILPYYWSNGQTLSRSQCPCGPIMCMPSSTGAQAAVRTAAGIVSALTVRLTCCNMFGIGCFGVGPLGVVEVVATPPVYDMDPTRAWSAQFTTLGEVWRRGGPIQLSSYAALQALEPSRPGISRRVHPALVPYLLLS